MIQMKNTPEKSFYLKLYIIIGMTAVIFLGLLYLIVSGGTEKIRSTIANSDASASSSAEVTAAPAVPASPAASAAASSSASSTSSPASTASATAAATASPESTTVPDTGTNTSILKIVNKTHMIEASYVPANLVEPDVPMNNTQLLRPEAASALEKMFAAAEKDGISLYFVSGYRSYEEQLSLYNYYVDQYGSDFADSIDCFPGASEHQIGLSVDLGASSRACALENCFQTTDAYAWLAKHAPEYGYILRYPQGGESSTGISYSPWAFRYVGDEAAKISQSGKTLEEYFGLK